MVKLDRIMTLMKPDESRKCAICGADAVLAERVEGFPYYLCSACSFFFMPAELSDVDYDDAYWKNEEAEAVRRENEDCCLRALELIYLSKIPVADFLDFGCGLGITVEWLRTQMGIEACGVDKYGRFEANSYLFKEDLLDRKFLENRSFDAIMSIEVVEHLPQNLILPIFERLRDLLRPGGLILINTGTLEFTKEGADNKKYIDPSLRGHISIFSLKTFKSLASRLGLVFIPMWSRSWCVLLLKPGDGIDVEISPWRGLDVNFDRVKKLHLAYPLLRQSLWAEELCGILRKMESKTPEGLSRLIKHWFLKK